MVYLFHQRPYDIWITIEMLTYIAVMVQLMNMINVVNDRQKNQWMTGKNNRQKRTSNDILIKQLYIYSRYYIHAIHIQLVQLFGNVYTITIIYHTTIICYEIVRFTQTENLVSWIRVNKDTCHPSESAPSGDHTEALKPVIDWFVCISGLIVRSNISWWLSTVLMT